MRKTSAVLVAVLAFGVSACGDSGGGSSGGLPDALDAVSAGAASEQSFAYTDVAALREETDLPTPGEGGGDDFLRWSVPATMGAPLLTQRVVMTRDGSGVDLFSADRFITIGTGNGATRIDGFEGDSEALTRLMDASSAQDGTIVVAATEEARDEALGQGGDKLSSRAEYASAANCLGDALAAMILPARSAGAPPEAGDVIAIGVRGGDDPADVLCVVGDADQAKRADTKLRDALDGEDEFADAEFDTGDSNDRDWARVVVTPAADGRLGAFYRSALAQLRLRSWLGDE